MSGPNSYLDCRGRQVYIGDIVSIASRSGSTVWHEIGEIVGMNNNTPIIKRKSSTRTYAGGSAALLIIDGKDDLTNG